MPKSPVGKFIDQRMEELGIPSVKQLAKMTGLSFSGLSKIRNTEMAMKSNTVEALAKALKCDYWEIKDLTPDEAPPPRQRKGADNLLGLQERCPGRKTWVLMVEEA